MSDCMIISCFDQLCMALIESAICMHGFVVALAAIALPYSLPSYLADSLPPYLADSPPALQSSQAGGH